MHKGEIAESGTHQESVDRRGIYWRLYQIQFGNQAEEELSFLYRNRVEMIRFIRGEAVA
jgi:hypothetical protein